MSEFPPESPGPTRAVRILETPAGPVAIYPRCPHGFFADLKLDTGLGSFSHYSSIIQKLEVFDRIAASRDGRVGLALLDRAVIVGYLTCAYPDSTERWSKLGNLMYELTTVEVSRNFRGIHLSSGLVGSVLHDDWFEDKIVYMNGYSWHWDLDGNGLTMAQYRNLMLNLMRKHGFQEYYTNEPNIAIREENVFMARVGSRVSPEDQQRFRNLRFGMVIRSDRPVAPTQDR
jgi:acetoin utilization protein AcuA